MTRALPSLLLVCASIAALPAAAADLYHRVGDNETLETIAKNYYGASWKSVYIQAANNLTGKDLTSGKKLLIPASWTYTARRGDSMTGIAKKRLGAEGRYAALMKFNNIKDPAELEVGRELLMPFHLLLVIKEGDTLEKLSRTYYRTPKYAPLIKEYNGADSLKTGAKLIVPIFDSASMDVRKRRYTAPPIQAQAAADQRHPQSRFCRRRSRLRGKSPGLASTS